MSRYFLSICAIVRNEAPYFREWTAFHRLQGISNFIIYHNRHGNDDKETMDVIAADAEKNKDISYIPWFGEKQQCKAYQHCLDTEGKDSEWIAFIDVDEFLWSPVKRIVKDVGPINFTVKEILDNYKDVEIAGITAQWILFGSNDHKEKKDGLVIERFTRSAVFPDKHCKSIVRPKYIESTGSNPHCFYSKKGYRIVNERGMELPREYAIGKSNTTNLLRINHYHTKSRAEYIARKGGNPDANSGMRWSPERIEESFKAHDHNEIEDPRVKDLYAEKIKETLNA